jgi:membrane protein required for beta-lactamase induction
MMIRSVVLFIHVIGVLVLFIGIAFEWLSLESLRRPATSEHASTWVRLHGVLPRVYGIAFAVLLVSGIYLARRAGVFEFAWVRLSLGLLVLMGILGGPAVRFQVHALRDAAGQGGGAGLEALHSRASHPWLRASLFIRTAMALAAVYLMIDKP